MIPFSTDIIREYVERGWWGTDTLTDFLDRNAARLPDKPAYVAGGESITWAQTRERVDRLAVGLARAGVRKDDMVLVQMPNSLEFVLVHLALIRLGAVTVPLVMPFRGHEIRMVRELCRPVMAIFHAEHGSHDFLATYRKVREDGHGPAQLVVHGQAELGPGELRLSDLLDAPLDPAELQRGLAAMSICADDVASMCLTSGTEAMPKGVPRTHNNWTCFAQVVPIDAWGRDSEDDVIVTPLPLPNLFGLGCGLYAALMLGQTMVLLDGFDPAACIRALDEHRATQFMGVPFMHMTMLNSKAMAEADLSHLVRVITGGAPASPAMIEAWAKLGVGVINGWGANEGTFCGTRWDQREHIADTIGPHPPSYDMYIADEEGTPLSPGNVGEIVMRGPCLFPGYWQRPDLDALAFDDQRYFHSGDLGMLGFDGYYRFQGRKKDLIIRGGQNISPEEIEFLVQEHPRVLHAAAVSMPGRAGEQVCVYVQLKQSGQSLDLAEMTAFLKEKDIAHFKMPKRVRVVDALPRTATGKVQKYKLREDARGDKE